MPIYQPKGKARAPPRPKKIMYQLEMEGLKFKSTLINENGGENMETLVSITVSRERRDIMYRVDCSSELLNEEFEYYLQEIINGICSWKPQVCEEKMQSYRGKIKNYSRNKT
jgi:hypothetical protein